MKSVDLSDEEILSRILSGEKELYRIVMDRYASLVFHVVRRYEHDNNLMTERAHEIFLKAYERLDSFKGKSAFSSWLYRLAHNHCLDESRRRKHRNTFFTELPDEDDHVTAMKDGNPGPDDEMDAASVADEQSARLWKALAVIDDNYAVPLLMKYRDGMSYEDISEDLNVPVGALKVRVHRARKELKSYLEHMI